MNVKQLIEANNRKRNMLTPENEEYYSDMMIYIRLQLTLSEQKTEEILMELLDHILDGQRDRKTAKEIFGEDAKAYADEIIQQLPKEDKRAIFPFLTGIAVKIISVFLMIRGVVFLIISPFINVETTVYVFNVFIMSVVIASIVITGVWFIFRLIKNSLFLEKSNDKINILKAGLFGASAFIVILVVSKLLPNKGPSFNFSWWASLLIGVVLWFGWKVIKRTIEKNDIDE